MTDAKALIVGLLMLTTPLVGCIGAVEDSGNDADTLQDDAADAVTDPARAASLHTPNGTSSPDLGDVLGEDQPLPVGEQRLTGFSAFEPTLGVTSEGNLFMSNSAGMPATGHSSIVKSTDGGATWEDATPRIGPVSSPPQSNDPYVHVDQETDRVFNLDMQGLQCNYLQFSDDEGETWTQNPVACGQPPLQDHPSLWTGDPRETTTVGYENVVYLCVNRLADAACAMSFDGGQSFTPWRTVFPEPGPDAQACGGLHGHGTTGPDGRTYLGKVHCGTPMVAVSEDDGLTWNTVPITTEHPSPKHDVEVAIDEAGNVYAMFVDDELQPYVSVSTDHGESWSRPVNVALPDVATAQFPAIAAGAEGKLAFVYLGTDSDEPVPDMSDEVAWNAYVATVPDALKPNPTIATSQVNLQGDPIARGPCDDDNRCDGIGDFIDIVIDDDGRPWSALVDVCHDACDAQSGNDEAIGAVGTLEQGFALRGNATQLPPLSSLADDASNDDADGAELDALN
jgi:hypothetical protein